MAWPSDSLNFWLVVAHSALIISTVIQTDLFNFFVISLARKLSHDLFGDVATNIFLVVRLNFFFIPSSVFGDTLPLSAFIAEFVYSSQNFVVA